MCSCPERVVWNTGYPFGIHAPTSFNSSGALAGWVSLLNGCADYLNGWLNTMWAGQRANPEHRPGSAGLVGNNQGSQQTVRFSWRGARSLGVRNGSAIETAHGHVAGERLPRGPDGQEGQDLHRVLLPVGFRESVMNADPHDVTQTLGSPESSGTTSVACSAAAASGSLTNTSCSRQCECGLLPFRYARQVPGVR